jgi:hypothetical protein
VLHNSVKPLLTCDFDRKSKYLETWISY